MNMQLMRLTDGEYIHHAQQPRNRFRRVIFRMVTSIWFDKVVAVWIFINVVFLSLEHYGQSDTWEAVLECANYVFLVQFLVEVLLKLIGLGPRLWARSYFNIFQGVTVILIVVLWAVQTTALNPVRLLRIARLFIIANYAVNMKILITSLLLSLSAVCNMLLLQVSDVHKNRSKILVGVCWGARKHSEAGYGRPVDRGAWTATTVKRPRQQPAHPQYANYWAPLTRKRHAMPHSAQPQHTNYWAPRTRKRHQLEHRPQRPTESSAPTQHAKGRTGDCPGPRKETTTKRNVTQGAGGRSVTDGNGK